jgi:hypothetical protein
MKFVSVYFKKKIFLDVLFEYMLVRQKKNNTRNGLTHRHTHTNENNSFLLIIILKKKQNLSALWTLKWAPVCGYRLTSYELQAEQNLMLRISLITSCFHVFAYVYFSHVFIAVFFQHAGQTADANRNRGPGLAFPDVSDAAGPDGALVLGKTVSSFMQINNFFGICIASTQTW